MLYGDNGARATSGGKITFNDGLVTTSASTLTATGGGAIYVYDKGGSTSYIGTTDVLSSTTVGIIDMTLGSGSAWYMTGDSSTTYGLLDMTTDGNTFIKLTLDTLTGNSLILMDIGTNGANAYNNSDIIKTENFTGTQTIGRIYKSGDYSDTWFVYGLGAAFKFGNPNAKNENFLYFDVECSAGGDLNQEWFYSQLTVQEQRYVIYYLHDSIF